MPKHVMVIGGGVIGLCSAWFARQHGHAVTVLERGPAAHDMASLGNLGMIVPSHFTPLATPGNVSFGVKNLLNPESPFYIRPRPDRALIDWGLKFMRAANSGQIARAEPLLRDLHMRSRVLFDDLANSWGNPFGLAKHGLLMLCNSARGLAGESAAAARANELGVPAEVLTADQTRALDPGISLDITGAAYYPNDCHLSPMAFVAALTRKMREQGVAFHFDQTVTGWRMANGAVAGVITAAATHEADEYVIAGGAWSDALAAQLGVNMPLQGGKGYTLTLPNPRQSPKICALLAEARAGVTPMGGALRVGGTMEVAGKDDTINPRRVRGIVKSFVKYYNAFAPQDFDKVPAWRGLRPVSPDGLPYIGRLPGHANVIAAAGHAMMGLSLAPVSGEIVGDLVSGALPSFDMAMVSPGRFSR